MTALTDITEHLDALLRTSEIPDYPPAMNGLQLENRGQVARVATAVDFSLRTVEAAVEAGADLLVVHHGMFWSGARALRGTHYRRLVQLIDNDVAVYASHLPLDVHPEIGNNVLLAHELGLAPDAGFARFQTIEVGVRGTSDIATIELVNRARALAERHGGRVVVTPHGSARRTHRFGICTGAGASSDTIREALAHGIDTLIVGEGPHHTGVEAADAELVIIYAGHYATETLGVQALGARIEQQFGLPWTFLDLPTGL
jgi:dinuclear metal center YbgI/SA1388 family protein